jgi:hypothetical protein
VPNAEKDCMIFEIFQLFLEEMKTYVKYQTIAKTSKFGKRGDTYSALNFQLLSSTINIP